ncbi:regulatory protein (GGDEF domain) [Legionella busanensis]|uniref:Regulatory protein (GGDEF domain) n=1 Tax=Legionella busanensis TaxID=190655 RepID=A0A378KE47_9GAMM|nr:MULTISPECIES: BLUF domain-containing protein [Legionella]STX81512.1 regulatory protein (GGDEF domain) [Legionella busanensis]
MSALYQLLFKSQVKKPLTDQALTQLAKLCRFKNFTHQLSGLLVYSNEHFYQLLEGRLESLESVYQCILQDRRHQKVVLLAKEPIAERTFWRWHMKRAVIDDKGDIRAQLIAQMQKDNLLASTNKNDGGFILKPFSNMLFKQVVKSSSTL